MTMDKLTYTELNFYIRQQVRSSFYSNFISSLFFTITTMVKLLRKSPKIIYFENCGCYIPGTKNTIIQEYDDWLPTKNTFRERYKAGLLK
jgi:hypothetical protein